MVDGSVCRRKGCSLCCRETAMELTNGDISRLDAAGKRDFYVEEDGGKFLKNLKGRCMLLDDVGLCTAYADRPLGCRIYPLVMSLPSMVPEMDEECPNTAEFSFDPEDIMVLERHIHTLLEEMG